MKIERKKGREYRVDNGQERTEGELKATLVLRGVGCLGEGIRTKKILAK